MPAFPRSAIASFGCSPFATHSILFAVFLLIAQPVNSALRQPFVPPAVGQPTREYAYEPISDTMLRAMLGYGAKKEQNLLPVQILLSPRSTNEMPMESERNDEAANDQQRVVMAKRNNAELVNHILKNFASLNRLGDAGRK